MADLKQELQAVMTAAAQICNTQHYSDLKKLWDDQDAMAIGWVRHDMKMVFRKKP